MSQVTFIIGNGLDLSLGIKSRYKDFYHFVQQQKGYENNRIYKDVADNPDNWADFESQLGKYTHYMSTSKYADKIKESDVFHDDLGEVLEDLANYLVKQEDEVKDLPNKFGFNPVALYDGLYEGQEEIVRRAISDGSTPQANFITLNYTTTLEKILDSIYFPSLGWTATKPLHIHGNNERSMTLGVSDETQLYEGMSPDGKVDLIKPDQIRSMNDGRLQRLDGIIKSSRIIVLFGTSVGDSDKYLWNTVAEWLKTGQNFYLVIHKRDKNYGPAVIRNPRLFKQYVKRAQDGFLKHTDLDDIIKEDLRRRIFVVHNSSNLFYPKPAQ